MITTDQIAKYVDANINLRPNQNYTIYSTPSGLTHTVGSMEYRDNDYKEVMGFITMDEVPEGINAIRKSVKFQRDTW